ncbi:MAG TPA: hypothetical protein V6D18_15005 [Thermosynechococcaceae cyanobacterium]
MSNILLTFASLSPVQAQPTAPLSSFSTGSLSNYPSGTRIESTGWLRTPTGKAIVPNVSVPRGDGSTTFYYPNGNSFTVPPHSVSPTGTYLSPSAPNGGLRSGSTCISVCPGTRN